MESARGQKPLVYLLLWTSVFGVGVFLPTANAAPNIPVGELISSGEVKLAAGETWRKVESFQNPLFVGTKIRTEKGVAALQFSDDVRVEIGERSFFSLEQKEILVLNHGSIQFRIPVFSQVTFKAGGLLIAKSRAEECVVGTMVLRPEGALTVKTLQGDLSIRNEDQVVLTRLGANEAITIPSILVKTPPKTVAALTAQAVKTTEPIDELQPRSVGFMISTESEGEKGVTPSAGSGGLFPTIRERVRQAICP